jgi:hypothetical protein
MFLTIKTRKLRLASTSEDRAKTNLCVSDDQNEKVEIMAHPLVVHFKRAPYDVYGGRPGPWGNPFSAGTREENIAWHAAWILKQPRLLEDLEELAEKVWGCWCAPQACHCDTLARLANGEGRHDWPRLARTYGVGWPD